MHVLTLTLNLGQGGVALVHVLKERATRLMVLDLADNKVLTLTLTLTLTLSGQQGRCRVERVLDTSIFSNIQSQWKIGVEAGELLAQLLIQHACLMRLYINNNSLGDKVCCAVARGVGFSNSLTELSLANNSIEQDGA